MQILKNSNFLDYHLLLRQQVGSFQEDFYRVQSARGQIDFNKPRCWKHIIPTDPLDFLLFACQICFKVTSSIRKNTHTIYSPET